MSLGARRRRGAVRRAPTPTARSPDALASRTTTSGHPPVGARQDGGCGIAEWPPSTPFIEMGFASDRTPWCHTARRVRPRTPSRLPRLGHRADGPAGTANASPARASAEARARKPEMQLCTATGAPAGDRPLAAGGGTGDTARAHRSPDRTQRYGRRRADHDPHSPGGSPPVPHRAVVTTQGIPSQRPICSLNPAMRVASSSADRAAIISTASAPAG